MKSRSSLGALRRFPFVWMAVAFSIGIFVHVISGVGWRASLAVCVTSAVAVLVLRGTSVTLVLLGTCFVFAGASAMAWGSAVPPDRLARMIDEGVIGDGDPVRLRGYVTGSPEPAFNGFFVTVRAVMVAHKDVETGAQGRVRLFIAVGDEERRRDFKQMGISRGVALSAVFRIRRGERYLNPGMLRMRQVLAEKGLDATGTVKSLLLLEVEETPQGVLDGLDPAVPRNWLVEEFRNRLSAPTAGVMIASLLGDKYFLDKRTADLFREGGTFHVLVISGLHITFIGGLILWVSACFTKNPWFQCLASSSVLWAFALAVGGEIPVVRAAVMFTVLLLLRAINRDQSPVNAFGASALIVLAWRPSDIFSPSFVLTFVCTGAIVAMAVPIVTALREIGTWVPTKQTPLPPRVGWALKRFCETLYWREEAWEFVARRNAWTGRIFKIQAFGRVPFRVRRLFAHLVEGLLVSVIVQLCLLPLQIGYFHRISTGGILLNLWVEAVIAVETFVAILAIAVANVSEILAGPFISLTELLNGLLLLPHEVFSDGGFASVRVPVYPFTDSLSAVYVAILTAVAARIISWNPFVWTAESNSKMRKVGSAAIVLSLIGFQLLVVLHPLSAPPPNGSLRIDFLDVGQGDSMLVTFPDGKTMLIDGGGRATFGGDETNGDFEPDIRGVGEAVVSEFLWEKGYSRIDYVLATHADTDHMQGLAEVVRNFDVGRVFVARLASEDQDFIELTRELDRKSQLPELLARGDRLEIGGVTVDVLNPMYSPEMGAHYGNAESIVLLLKFGARRFLLAGDIEKEGEKLMLARPDTLRADLVKVAHHGSRSSSTDEFVEAAHASYAVVSVGRTSPFGHPHPEVVDRWERAGAKVLRTGETGTVTAETDGKSLSVRTFIGGG